MPIEPVLVPIAAQFGVSANRVEASLENFRPEHLFAAPDNVNPMFWLFGHATNTRCGLLNLMGRETPQPWKDLFSRGAELSDPSAYPALDAVRAAWDEACAAMDERFETITAEELAMPSPREFPLADKSVLGAAAFLAFHEGYHLGQMAALRKWLGYGKLVG